MRLYTVSHDEASALKRGELLGHGGYGEVYRLRDRDQLVVKDLSHGICSACTLREIGVCYGLAPQTCRGDGEQAGARASLACSAGRQCSHILVPESVWVRKCRDTDSDGEQGPARFKESSVAVVMKRYDDNLASEQARGICSSSIMMLRVAMRGLLHALACMHEVGVLHRDVDPSNILVSYAARDSDDDNGGRVSPSARARSESGGSDGGDDSSPEPAAAADGGEHRQAAKRGRFAARQGRRQRRRRVKFAEVVLADTSLAMYDARFVCSTDRKGGCDSCSNRVFIPQKYIDARTHKVAKVTYRAPELLLAAAGSGRRYTYGPEVDVWSAGVVMAEMSTPGLSFAPDWDTQYDVLLHIFRRLGTPSASAAAHLAGYDAATFPDWSARCPVPLETSLGDAVRDCAPAVDLMRRMLCLDPNARISAADALRHPFLCDVGGSVPPCVPLLPGPPTPMKQLAFLLRAGGVTGRSHGLPRSAFEHGGGEVNERMYQVLMDWLVEVECNYRLSQDTFFVGREVLLSFAARCERGELSRLTLQGYGCAAQYVASNVVEEFPPELRDYAHVCAGLYSLEQMRCMVDDVVVAVEGRVVLPSAWHCARLVLAEHGYLLLPAERGREECDADDSDPARGNGERVSVWRVTLFLCTLAAVSGAMVGRPGVELGFACALASAMACAGPDEASLEQAQRFRDSVLRDASSVAMASSDDICAAAAQVLQLAASLDSVDARVTFKAVVVKFKDIGGKENWSRFASKCVCLA